MADLELLPYPPDLAADQQEQLINTVTDWLIAHGLFAPPQIRDRQDPTYNSRSFLPISHPCYSFPQLVPAHLLPRRHRNSARVQQAICGCRCGRRLAFCCYSR